MNKTAPDMLCLDIECSAQLLRQGITGKRPMSEGEAIRLLGEITRNSGRLLTGIGMDAKDR